MLAGILHRVIIYALQTPKVSLHMCLHRLTSAIQGADSGRQIYFEVLRIFW